MKTKPELEAMIARLESDDRYKYPPADPFVNSPLALIQVELKGQVAALRWAAGLDDQMATSATEAKKPKKPSGKKHSRAITDGHASFSCLNNECGSIGCMNEADNTQVDPMYCRKHQTFDRPQPKRTRKKA